MNFFSRGCASRETAYLIAADRVGPGERLALEAHAASCVECADALRSSGSVDAALRGAFAPLRERRTIIAPGRVRLAVGPRATAATNPLLRAPRLFGRLAEVSVMIGVTLFAVTSAMDFSTRPSPGTTSPRSVVQDYFRAQPPLADKDYVRWLRLVKVDASSPSVAAPTRLPVGGVFDVEPAEIAKGPVSPR